MRNNKDKTELYVVIITIGILIVLIGILWMGLKQDRALNGCIEKEYNIDYCEKSL